MGDKIHNWAFEIGDWGKKMKLAGIDWNILYKKLEQVKIGLFKSMSL